MLYICSHTLFKKRVACWLFYLSCVFRVNEKSRSALGFLKLYLMKFERLHPYIDRIFREAKNAKYVISHKKVGHKPVKSTPSA
jgi:hypothetical protein